MRCVEAQLNPADVCAKKKQATGRKARNNPPATSEVASNEAKTGDGLMPQPSEIVKIGNRYGKLVVVDKMPHQPNKPPYWRCKCDCGNETIVVGHSLRNGLTTSCGCYKREKV